MHLVLGIEDRKSTRLNSSHSLISYAVFCLKKKSRSLQQTRHGLPEAFALQQVWICSADRNAPQKPKDSVGGQQSDGKRYPSSSPRESKQASAGRCSRPQSNDREHS